MGLTPRERIRLRDLLTEDGYPLRADEWFDHSTVRSDGSVLVTLFGAQTQIQAAQILRENAPTMTVEFSGTDSIIVR